MSLPGPDLRPPQFTRIHCLVLVLLGLAMAAAYLVRGPGAFSTTIQAQLELDNTQIQAALGGFEFGYIWLQIPAGWLGMVLGVRRALPLMCLGWSACTAAWALSPDEQSLYLARFGMGLFQGGLIPCSAMAVAEWFSPRVRGMTSGVVNSSMQAGGVTTLLLSSRLLNAGLSWRTILLSYSAVGVAWSLAFYFLFRDRPSEHPWLNRREDLDGPPPEPPPMPTWADIATLLSTVSLWLLCAQQFFRAYAYTFFPNAFSPFLQKGRGLTLLNSTTLNIAPILGVLVGGLVGGVLVDLIYRRTGSKYLSRSGTALFSLLASASCTAAACRASDATQATLIISGGAFFAGLSGPVTWAAVIDVCGKRTGVLLGLVNMCGNIGAALFQKHIGPLFDHIQNTKGDWNLVLYLVAGIYLSAAACWLFLDPNRSAAAEEEAANPPKPAPAPAST